MAKFFQGQHIWARFPGGEVKAIILEIGSEDGKVDLKVQEEGTQRAEWILAENCRPR